MCSSSLYHQLLNHFQYSESTVVSNSLPYSHLLEKRLLRSCHLLFWLRLLLCRIHCCLFMFLTFALFFVSSSLNERLSQIVIPRYLQLDTYLQPNRTGRFDLLCHLRRISMIADFSFETVRPRLSQHSCSLFSMRRSLRSPFTQTTMSSARARPLPKEFSSLIISSIVKLKRRGLVTPPWTTPMLVYTSSSPT